MKKLVIGAALLALSLALGGCITTDVGSIAAGDVFVPQTPVGTGPVSSKTGFVAAVVRGAQTSCNFRPSSAVVDVIATAEPAAATVSGLAKAFCDAVAPLASGPGSEGIRQGYVHVNGHYYRLNDGRRVTFHHRRARATH